MARKVKMLGFALLALLAVGAAAASAASAHHRFFSEQEKTILIGETDVKHKLTLGEASLECASVKRESTLSGSGVGGFAFTPVYEGCTFAGKKAVVRMNGCQYSFTGVTDANEDAGVNVECAAGIVIEIEVEKFSGENSCTITFGAQSPAGGVHYTNLGAENERTITVNATIQEIVVSSDGPGLLCTSLGKLKAKTTGAFILKGKEDQGAGKQVGVWFE